MRLLVISLFALFLSLMLVISGNSYLLTLTGVQLGSSGVSPTKVGYIMTGYAVGFVLGALYAPRLLLKVGHIRSFAALASLTSMAAISYPLTDNLIIWGILRVVGGFSVAGLFIAIESWFSAVASDQNRATLFALYQVAAYSASAGGQLMLDLGVSTGPNIAFTLGGLLLMAAVIPLSISRMQSPPMENAQMMSPRRLWSRAALGLYGAFSGGILIGGFYALIPLFGTLTQRTNTEIGQLMSTSVLAAMLVAWPLGWLCDRVSRSNVLFGVSLTGLAMGIIAFLFSAQNAIVLIICCAVLMAGVAAVYSISVAITNDLVNTEERVGASSTLMLSYGIGSILGPLGGSWLMQTFMPEALFLGFAATLLLLAGFTRYRQIQIPPLSVEEQEHFVPAIPEAQINVEFDPRTEDLPDTPLEELFPEDMQQDIVAEADLSETSEAEPANSENPTDLRGDETQTDPNNNKETR